METKHLFALILLVGLGSAGLIATLFWQRMRDAVFFILLFGAVFVRKFMDVTFGGEFWYRGTIRGFEVTALDIAAWCVLAATLLAPRYPGRRWFWPAGAGMFTLYFLYCAWSVTNSDPVQFGLWELTRIFRGLIIIIVAAWFVRSERELKVMVLAIGCAIWFMGLNAIEQRVWKGVLRPPATLDHENSFSMYLCTVAPVMMAAALSNWSPRLRIFAASSCALAALAELMTLSRAGVPVFCFVMAGTAVCCTSWKLTRTKVLILAGCVMATGLVLIVIGPALYQRYASQDIVAEFRGDEDGFETRGEYWRLAAKIAEDRPFGVGLNNWSYHVSKTYAGKLGIRYNDYDEIGREFGLPDGHVSNFAPPAHSLAVITWGELGLAGVLVFALVWIRWFQMGASFLRGRLNPDPMHRMAIGFLFGTVGIFLQSVTEWTYRQTPIMFTFHVMMGALASLYYWRRAQGPAPQPVEDEPDEPVYEVEAQPVGVSAVRVQR